MKKDSTPKSSSLSTKTALVTGSVALGAAITGAVFRKIRRAHLFKIEDIPHALDVDTHEMEMMEGKASFYFHDGTGIPFVFLHDQHAFGSSFDFKPLFDLLSSSTNRPLYALDWLGFGLSERPAIRYSPSLYQRQLRRFLSEHVQKPADVIAQGLASEYASITSQALPFLVNKLVLISPTSTSSQPKRRVVRQIVGKTADTIGAFEIYFHRFTRPSAIRRFFERHVFLKASAVPDALLEYAYTLTHVDGAHFAPRYYFDGTLFSPDQAFQSYTQTRVPTLLVVPETTSRLSRSFEGIAELEAHKGNLTYLKTIPTGLMPHWESTDLLGKMLGDFLSSDE